MICCNLHCYGGGMIPVSKNRLAQDTILDSINEGVFTVDLNWRITAFNRAAERITGVPREEALGKECCDVFHANICEKDCALRRTFHTGKSIINATAHFISHQGLRVPVRLSAAILKDEKGVILGGVETFQDLREIEALQKELRSRYTLEDIVGRSPEMIRLFELLPQVADSRSTILIEGPSGTGKELFARAVHNLSPRKNNKFLPVNCAALPDSLLESELFGHKAGAFTDARKNKAGRFTQADGGTIFLDEIGDISPALQVKLLRVLQDFIIEPLGATEPHQVDVRVVAATNKDLVELVRTGKFREDLYYRIKVIHLVLPGLKERREDIPLLVEHIVNKFNHRQGKDIAGLSPETMSRLMEHDFPGNIRELENIIEQAFVLCRGSIIELHHLPPELRPASGNSPDSLGPMNLKSIEKHIIAETLRYYHGNRRRAAHNLGIDVSTLYRKIKTLGIDTPETDGRGRRG